ncbi:TrmH family RNA methyltransferase [Deferrisoma sp.]
MTVYGRNACRALAERRPGDVLRAFLTEERVGEFGPLLRHLARRRSPYRVVGPEELERISGSWHHEGICLVAKLPQAPNPEELATGPGPARVLALAGVSNPHNLGAIVRTAAHFGARCVLTEGGSGRLPPAAWRTAEGGAEWVPVLRGRLPALLAPFRGRGFRVIATSSHGGEDLFRAAMPERVVFLLGAEGPGLPREALEAADLAVRIPGTGWVESLNVATAAGILLAEAWRRHTEPRQG